MDEFWEQLAARSGVGLYQCGLHESISEYLVHLDDSDLSAMSTKAKLFKLIRSLFHLVHTFSLADSMTAVFEKQDLKFMYPENWSLTQDIDQQELPWQVTLETPKGALFSISVFDKDADAKTLIDNTTEALREQYEDIEVSEIADPFHGYDSTGADAFFYCLDFLVTSRVRVIATDRYTYLFYNQAESREFDTNEQVFQAIALNVLQNATDLQNS